MAEESIYLVSLPPALSGQELSQATGKLCTGEDSALEVPTDSADQAVEQLIIKDAPTQMDEALMTDYESTILLDTVTPQEQDECAEVVARHCAESFAADLSMTALPTDREVKKVLSPTTMQLAISIPLPSSASCSRPCSPSTDDKDLFIPTTMQLAVSIPLPASAASSRACSPSPDDQGLFSPTTMRLAISIPLPASATSSRPCSPVPGDGNEPQSLAFDVSTRLQLLNDNVESFERDTSQQHKLETLQEVGSEIGVVQSSEQDQASHAADNNSEDLGEDCVVVKRRAQRRRNLEDDDDDEGGERGTIIILESTHRRLFDLTSINNAINNGNGYRDSHQTVSTFFPAKKSDSVEPFKTHSNVLETAAVIDEGEKTARTNNRQGRHDSGDSDNIVGEDSEQVEFSLEPSGFGDSEGNIVMAGAFFPASSSPSSTSTPSSSASSSSFSSPVSSRRLVQRPYSQFQPKAFRPDGLSSPKHGSFIDQLQQKQLRRARSLPSSPCSPAASSRSRAAMAAISPPHSTLAGDPLTRAILLRDDEVSLRAPQVDGLSQEQRHSIERRIGVSTPPGLILQQLMSSPAQDTGSLRESCPDSPTMTPSASMLGSQQPHSLNSGRPRRQSLLSPRQLQVMSQERDNVSSSLLGGGTFGKKAGFGGFIRDQARRGKHNYQKRAQEVLGDKSNASEHSKKQHGRRHKYKQKKAPSPRSMPAISFQPHATEISTDRPAVSGRLILHIPRLAGLKFRFISLALHLRLKESISWTKQDLVSFGIDKHHWAQTVWDKKMMLQFQDKQVEEGRENAYLGTGPSSTQGPATSTLHNLTAAEAVAAAALASTSSTTSQMCPESLLSPSPAVLPSAAGSAPKESAARTAKSNSAATSSAGMHCGSDGTLTSSMAKRDRALDAPYGDEWRWEWLLPVTKNEVRPESFEGSMGLVWYELEAKCLFRWDKVDEEGQILVAGNTQSSMSLSSHSLGGSYPDANLSHGIGTGRQGTKDLSGSNKLLKGLGASTNKSIAQVFGKLRGASKSKKTQQVGDFKLGTQHEEYIKNSIQKAKEAAAAANIIQDHDVPTQKPSEADSALSPSDEVFGPITATAARVQNTITKTSKDDTTATAKTSPSPQGTVTSSGPVPFLIRKTLKLYFTRPPPKESSSSAFFLPAPSMSLPTLPSTRRLKAIIPGAKIQVQIQVPTIIPMRGYANTSCLVPCSKTGGLVALKHDSDGVQGGDRRNFGIASLIGDQYESKQDRSGKGLQQQYHQQQPQRQQQQHQQQQLDARYPDNFQAALTIRKVTKKDIEQDDILRRRYENAQVAAEAVSNSLANHQAAVATLKQGSTVRKRLLSHCQSDPNVSGAPQSANASGLPVSHAATGGGVEAGELPVCTDGVEAAVMLPEPERQKKRTEIRVRKVRCEFWQKETCRIPTDAAPSRSVKVPLGPVFTYTEKDFEKERLRNRNIKGHHEQKQQRGIPLSRGGRTTTGSEELQHTSPLQPEHPSSAPHVVKDTGNTLGPRSPAFSVKGDDCRPLEPLPFSIGARKESLGAIVASPLSRPSATAALPLNSQQSLPSNKPFMLLVPIPLDSPKLRQTYAWPSSDTHSPNTYPGYEHSMLRGGPYTADSSGCGSELDYPSQMTMYEMAGSLAGNGDGYGNGIDSLRGGGISHSLSNTPAVKARIEVKHYLTFRISIDMLEYGVEHEQGRESTTEGLDLKASEKRQTSQQPAVKQEGAVHDNDHEGSEIARISGADEITLRPAPLLTGVAVPGHKDNGGSLMTSPTLLSPKSGTRPMAGPVSSNAASLSSIIEREMGIVDSRAGPGGLTAMEPALRFLNSTAGLLEMSVRTEKPSEAFIGGPSCMGMALDFTKRRGSKGSLGTVKSSKSGSSNGLASPGDSTATKGGGTEIGQGTRATAALTPKMSSSISGGNSSSVGSNIHLPPATGNGGGLMAGAIGAIKKKASGSALSSFHQHPPSQEKQRGSQTSGVTVQKLKDFVIRVPITVVIHTDDRGQIIGAYGRTGGSSGAHEDVADKTLFSSGKSRTQAITTATTTITNVITGSSAGLPEALEGTETFSSINSMAASIGSEPVLRRRMLDDFSSSSSLSTPLHVGLQRRQGLGQGFGSSLPLAPAHPPFQTLSLDHSYHHHGTASTLDPPASNPGSQVMKAVGKWHQDQRGGLSIGRDLFTASATEQEGDYDDDEDDEEEGEFVVVDAEEVEDDEVLGSLTYVQDASDVLKRIRQF